MNMSVTFNMDRSNFLESIKGDFDRELVGEAFDFAKEAHDGKFRKTGEDFITHPVAVAQILSEFCNDTASICAALLHDVVEDTDISLDEIEKRFGKETRYLVDGVTKLQTKDLTVKKVLDYGRKDRRVIYLKFADKLHNLETLHVHSPDKQKEIVQELKRLYIPEARRIGFDQAVRRFKRFVEEWKAL